MKLQSYHFPYLFLCVQLGGLRKRQHFHHFVAETVRFACDHLKKYSVTWHKPLGVSNNFALNIDFIKVNHKAKWNYILPNSMYSILPDCMSWISLLLGPILLTASVALICRVHWNLVFSSIMCVKLTTYTDMYYIAYWHRMPKWQKQLNKQGTLMDLLPYFVLELA